MTITFTKDEEIHLKELRDKISASVEYNKFINYLDSLKVKYSASVGNHFLAIDYSSFLDIRDAILPP